MPTGHFAVDMLENAPDHALKIAETLGVQSIYAPYLAGRASDGRGLARVRRSPAKIGKPFKDAGFDFGWHNHDFEFFALEDGSLPDRQIFAGGPDLSWEADIAWVVRGDADPFKWIETYGDRITAVHVKDIAPAARIRTRTAGPMSVTDVDWGS